MAEVISPADLSHPSTTMSSMSMPAESGPRIEMVPNPDFSFPMRPHHLSHSDRPSSAQDSMSRPASSFSQLSPSHSPAISHRRAVSTLPSFSFNANDASGRKESPTPPDTPQIPDADDMSGAPTTPSRRGHRRGTSEFVGGDSRLGVTNVVSTSPTKTAALPIPSGPPAGRRGHAHRRSAAISSHDLTSLMQAPGHQPRLSSSLPNTPLEYPGSSRDLALTGFVTTDMTTNITDPFGPPLDPSDERPPSSRRVGFSDNVTIIPRPLSTISSETGSSISTIRGHSVNNSISSVLSLSTPSPPASRAMRSSLSTTLEDESRPKSKLSLEISKRVEKEGQWLKSRSSSSLKRPESEAPVATKATTFALPDMPERVKNAPKKKRSFSYGQNMDRRKSEPTIRTTTDDLLSMSAISLDDQPVGFPYSHDDRSATRQSSTRKIKAWATSMISWKHKPQSHSEAAAASDTSSLRPDSADSVVVPGKIAFQDRPVAETDLDTVFNDSTATTDDLWSAEPGTQHAELSASAPSPRSQPVQEFDDPSAMIDLDAALGPSHAFAAGAGSRQRRELHSSRGTRDFNAFGSQFHRRTESAPELAVFEMSGVPPQASMDDVVEEEEEEDEEDAVTPYSQPESVLSVPGSMFGDDEGFGVAVVDAADDVDEDAFDSSGPNPATPSHEERPFENQICGFSSAGLRLPAIPGHRRGSSIVEETIFEEVSPVSEIEIVDAEDEPREPIDPRASSLTKSSDSSEAPTILGQQLDSLPPSANGMDSLHPHLGPDILLTPETFDTSAFSSPDFARRQASFETFPSSYRVGTSASSMTDNRTLSSCHTADLPHDPRISNDDVPSLTSSRSTMLSTIHANSSRRDFSGVGDRTPSASSTHLHESPISAPLAPIASTTSSKFNNATRRKRSSIQSLSQLVGGPFGSKSRLVDESRNADARPSTAVAENHGMLAVPSRKLGKRESYGRLKKLMFWKSRAGSGSRETEAKQGEAERGVGGRFRKDEAARLS